MSDVSRDGEPELKRGPAGGSIQQQNQYEIRTTPVPAGARGYDWAQFFNSRFTGQRPITGYHDGRDKATIYCWPDDESKLVGTVDAAIKYANEKALKG
ncbi:MAG: hypothetical protein ACLPLP_13115 [Mycobacterium sp.]